MRTWRSIEMVYGRAFMTRLRRRIIITHTITAITFFALGWWMRG